MFKSLNVSFLGQILGFFLGNVKLLAYNWQIYYNFKIILGNPQTLPEL